MPKLCITAHPSSISFTNRIGKLMGKRWIEVINLYDSEFKQEYLSFENVLDQPETEIKKIIQAKILESEEIILVFPIWWGSFPAVMKNFFDINLSYWFAFEHDTSWWIIRKLSWKKISVFCTCNSPLERYEKVLRHYFELHFQECCGIDIDNFYIFPNMMQTTDQQKHNIIQLIWNIYE